MNEEKILQAVSFLQNHNYENAFEIFYSLSQSNSEPCEVAVHYLAWMYEQGLHVEADIQMATEYWLKGALLGGCHSQLAVGDSYYRGSGFEQNFLKAYCWYKVAQHYDRKDEIGSDLTKQLSLSKSKLSVDDLVKSNEIIEDILNQIS